MTGRLRRLFLRGDQFAVDQAFGDLDGVERRAFAQIVGDDPHREAILDRGVLANAADVGGVLARRLIGRHIATRLMRIDDQAARRIAQDVARLVGRDLILELDVDGLGMADETSCSVVGSDRQF